ncbi:MAG: hypothetical protein WBQ43_13790 [Terriglobales bacterium]
MSTLSFGVGKRSQLKYRGLLFHNLRRTGMRNMVRVGATEKVAQTIYGHKTRAVSDRCNIVAPSDLRDAAHKLEVSQGLEREAMEKSGVPDFGQSWTKTGQCRFSPPYRDHAELGVSSMG